MQRGRETRLDRRGVQRDREKQGWRGEECRERNKAREERVQRKRK